VKRKKRQGEQKQTGLKGLMPAALMLAACGAVLALIYLLPGPKSISPTARPPFEDFSRHTRTSPLHPKPRRHKPAPHPQGRRHPLVAIIIDDMGYDYSTDEAFLHIDAPLSYAFLPFAPNTHTLSMKAAAMGRDVLVHLPLQPQNGSVDPGPGVLRLDMGFNTTIETLKRDIEAVPGATGLNNHMGSRYTEDPMAMKIVLAEVKRRHMFFVDSRTSANTVACTTAREMGIPAGQRAVFLDHTPQTQAVTHEINRLISVANERGAAIAIGHPTKVTLRVLYRELPGLMKKVRLVPVHVVVEKYDTCMPPVTGRHNP